MIFFGGIIGCTGGISGFTSGISGLSDLCHGIIGIFGGIIGFTGGTSVFTSGISGIMDLPLNKKNTQFQFANLLSEVYHKME